MIQDVVTIALAVAAWLSILKRTDFLVVFIFRRFETVEDLQEALQDRSRNGGVSKFICKLFACPWCLGAWLSLALTGLYQAAPLSVLPWAALAVGVSAYRLAERSRPH